MEERGSTYLHLISPVLVMMKSMLHGLNKLTLLILVALVVCSSGAAQIPDVSPSPTPTPENARPLYGLQGVLIETLDGKVVSSQNEYEQFNPASTLKLATALVALRTLG